MLALFAERGGDPDRPGKKDPLDACSGGPSAGRAGWDSAARPGRPGWHVECTAIALRAPRRQFDVQGGGSDLVFPHHEMSASHAQVADRRQPVRAAYAHAGMVGYQGEKMSKSRGNLVFVSRLRAAGVDPVAIRLALLAHHYRSDWEWTDDRLGARADRLARWRAAVALPAGRSAEQLLATVRARLADDLDAPGACRGRRLGGDAVRATTSAGAPRLVRDLMDALLGVQLGPPSRSR